MQIFDWLSASGLSLDAQFSMFANENFRIVIAFSDSFIENVGPYEKIQD